MTYIVYLDDAAQTRSVISGVSYVSETQEGDMQSVTFYDNEDDVVTSFNYRKLAGYVRTDSE